ncbi:glycosyltransferase [Pseudomonas sp. JDS28PS106]|uniref:glycosyltransferase n=1 Tax=Pseudomonas sp. JDS28PS106 TaxID=2497235 RepID=UPI002FD0CDCB
MFELDKCGYIYDTTSGVWVRADYEGIAYSDGDASENELARIVRDAGDVSVFSSELTQYCTDWPKLYHLSSSRGNIFRPFENLLDGKSVLEIGAGCGAISRYLGEVGANVLSLEGSPRRAAIAASRTRDLANVTVLAERFDDFETEHQFDVVTLIGVLEYASMFSADADPAYGMLKRILGLLKPDGRLFIAIENQLGLKYFAGAPEDHLGISMYGIEGRYVDRQPKTFGKRELEALVSRAGFASSSFLSPYPDYKIPNSLITESGFTSPDFDAAALASQNTRKDPQLPANTTFNLEKAWPVVIDNDLGMHLANSFLVVASRTREEVVPKDVLGYHYSTSRTAAFCKASIFVQTAAGIEVQYQRIGGGSGAKTDESGFRFILPESHGYAKGTLFSSAFLEASTTRDWNVETFTPFLSNYLSHLSYLLALEGHSAVLDRIEALLPAHYIDAVPHNIVIDEQGKPNLIDIEWEMVGGIELGHLLTRALLLLIASASPFYATGTMICRRDFIIQLMQSAGLVVTEEELNRYAVIEATFQEKVTGRPAITFVDWSPEATIPKLGSMTDEEPKLATLYYGDADGAFSEQRTKSQQVHDGHQTLIFSVPATAKCGALRFDPTNTRQSFSVETIKIHIDNTAVWAWDARSEAPLAPAGTTAFCSGAGGTLYMALNEDPHFVLPLDIRSLANSQSFKVQISFTLLSESDVAERLHRQEEELKLALESTSDAGSNGLQALQAIKMANEAALESHRLAIAELEATNRSAHESHRRTLAELQAETQAIKENDRRDLMDVEDRHSSELAAIQAEHSIVLENHRMALTELRSEYLAQQERHRTALADIEAENLELRERHRQEIAELQVERLYSQDREHRNLAHKDTQIDELNLGLSALQSSYSWKITAPLRRLARAAYRAKRIAASLRSIIRRGGGVVSTTRKALEVWRSQGISGVIAQARWVHNMPAGTPEVPDRHDYGLWIKNYDTLDDARIEGIKNDVASWDDAPLISVIMPVYNPPIDLLMEAVESVRAQLYPHWELCIADDASSDPEVKNYLRDLTVQENRVKVVFRESNGHIVQASNSALALAQGQYIALMDNDDLLASHALYCVARAIRENPDAGLIYSDEDKVDINGVRSAPYFKPDWNEFLFRSQNVICHLAAYRRTLVEQVGQFREGYEGAQDYDLALRCADALDRRQIVHIPHVLYHWRIHAGSTALGGDEKPYAALAGVRALDDHLQRKGGIGTAELLPLGMYRVRYTLPNVLPLVSLVIPTRNAHGLVKQCVDSIRNLTTYPHYEIILIDNGSDDPDSLEYFALLNQEERIRVLRDDGPFNYSALNNRAVQMAQGELIGLINNDIEVISPGWLDEMVSIALQPQVGAVGARLWYPDDRLQHGGIIVGLGGVAGHSHKYLPKGAPGYFCRGELIQEFSAVTAACLIVKKSVFEEVDGLNENHLKIAFNDVDFCLKVQEAGYVNVWTPYAELYHHESATRGVEDTAEKQARFAEEIQYMKSRWPNILDDYAYSPNLTLDREDFSLAWPSRSKI